MDAAATKQDRGPRADREQDKHQDLWSAVSSVFSLLHGLGGYARIEGERIYDASGRQIGRVEGERLFSGSGTAMGRIEGERIYDASGRQIGRTDGLRRMQTIVYFYFFM